MENKEITNNNNQNDIIKNLNNMEENIELYSNNNNSNNLINNINNNNKNINNIAKMNIINNNGLIVSDKFSTLSQLNNNNNNSSNNSVSGSSSGRHNFLSKRSVSSIALNTYLSLNSNSKENNNSSNHHHYHHTITSSTSLTDFSNLATSPSILDMSMGALSIGSHGGVNIDFSNRDLSKVPTRYPCEKEKIESLNLSNNNFSIISNDFFNIHFNNLTTLNFEHNKLKKIPKSIKYLNGLVNLKLANNKFKKFPKNLFKLTNLLSLNLSNNKIESISKDIVQMKCLRELYLSNNSIHQIPHLITEMSLFTFTIDNNPITVPPPEICELGLEKILDYLNQEKEKEIQKSSKSSKSSNNVNNIQQQQQSSKVQLKVQIPDNSIPTSSSVLSSPIHNQIHIPSSQQYPPNSPSINNHLCQSAFIPISSSSPLSGGGGGITSSQSMYHLSSNSSPITPSSGTTSNSNHYQHSTLPTSMSTTSLSSSNSSNSSCCSSISGSNNASFSKKHQPINKDSQKLFSVNGDSMLIQSTPTAITNTNYPINKKIKSRPPSPKHSKEKVLEIQQALINNNKNHSLNNSNNSNNSNSSNNNSSSNIISSSVGYVSGGSINNEFLLNNKDDEHHLISSSLPCFNKDKSSSLLLSDDKLLKSPTLQSEISSPTLINNEQEINNSNQIEQPQEQVQQEENNEQIIDNDPTQIEKDSQQPESSVPPVLLKSQTNSSPIFERFLHKFSKKSKSKSSSPSSSTTNSSRKLKKHSSLSEIEINIIAPLKNQEKDKLKEKEKEKEKEKDKSNEKEGILIQQSNNSNNEIFEISNDKIISNSCQISYQNNSSSTPANEPSIKELINSFNNGSTLDHMDQHINNNSGSNQINNSNNQNVNNCSTTSMKNLLLTQLNQEQQTYGTSSPTFSSSPFNISSSPSTSFNSTSLLKETHRKERIKIKRLNLDEVNIQQLNQQLSNPPTSILIQQQQQQQQFNSSTSTYSQDSPKSACSSSSSSSLSLNNNTSKSSPTPSQLHHQQHQQLLLQQLQQHISKDSVDTNNNTICNSSQSPQTTPEIKPLSPPFKSSTKNTFLSLSVSMQGFQKSIHKKMSTAFHHKDKDGQKDKEKDTHKEKEKEKDNHKEKDKGIKTPVTSPTLGAGKPVIPLLSLQSISTDSPQATPQPLSNGGGKLQFHLNLTSIINQQQQQQVPPLSQRQNNSNNNNTLTIPTSSLAELNSTNPTSPRGHKNRSHFRNNSSDTTPIIDLNQESASVTNNNSTLNIQPVVQSKTLTPPPTSRRERRGTISSERDLRMMYVPMLSDIVKDVTGRKYFRDFLLTEFSQENIDFWVAVEEYRKLDSKEKLLVEAERIYTQFVIENSANQINIPFNCLKEVEQNYTKKLNLPTMFDNAQGVIFQLMECDSFERFKKSTFYFQYYHQTTLNLNNLINQMNK